jgi:peptidoglycan biosynthesis protein MviN/MurJ (putative lipid II flippase)
MTEKAKAVGLLILYIAFFVYALSKGVVNVVVGCGLFDHEDDPTGSISLLGHGIGLLCICGALVMAFVAQCTRGRWAPFLFKALVVVAFVCIMIGIGTGLVS